MSIFNDNFNGANVAFGGVTVEQFEVVKNGNVGLYDAISIDDLVAANATAPGGFRGDNTVTIHLLSDTITTSGVIDGSILVVRGKRVRVTQVTNDGDNTPALQCTTAGVKI